MIDREAESRKEFETIAVKHGWDVTRGEGAGYYLSTFTRGVWEGWQVWQASRAGLESQLAQQKVGDDLKLAKAVGINYCAELAQEGRGWEVPAEPEPQYFETLIEAVTFLVNLPDRELQAQLAQARAELAEVKQAYSGLFNADASPRVEKAEAENKRLVEALRESLELDTFPVKCSHDEETWHCASCRYEWEKGVVSSRELRKAVLDSTPSPAPLMHMGHEICGAPVGTLTPFHAYCCVMSKGHEGEHQRGGDCIAHGEYIGEQCPQWPQCVTVEGESRRNFVSDPIPAPFCTVCGTPMEFKCAKCGLSPSPTY